jgi:hypothetical protein
MRELAMSDELDILFKLYWILFFHLVFDYLQMWGVAPWYPESVGNTIHRIPVCPPFGAGRIQTWLGPNRKQRFQYIWTDGEVDSRMFFEVKNNPPLFDGRLTSPMVTMLKDHKLILEVREALDIVVYRQAHTQHIFEFHPPKNVVGDDGLMVLEGLGDSIAGTVLSQTEKLHNQKFFLRADTTQQALAMAREANDKIKSKHGTGKVCSHLMHIPQSMKNLMSKTRRSRVLLMRFTKAHHLHIPQSVYSGYTRIHKLWNMQVMDYH